MHDWMTVNGWLNDCYWIPVLLNDYLTDGAWLIDCLIECRNDWILACFLLPNWQTDWLNGSNEIRAFYRTLTSINVFKLPATDSPCTSDYNTSYPTLASQRHIPILCSHLFQEAFSIRKFQPHSCVRDFQKSVRRLDSSPLEYIMYLLYGGWFQRMWHKSLFYRRHTL